MMKIGIDVVEIDRTHKIILESAKFVDKILSPEEIGSWNLQSICGKIAAKEAIIKTGYISAGEWKKVKVIASDSGEPQIFDENHTLISKIHISISHTPTLAIAVAVYE